MLKTTTETHSFTFLVMNPKFIGNKVKKQISKRVFQENNARQIFRKTNISYQATDINFFKVYLNKILKPTWLYISAIKVNNFLEFFFQSKHISYLGNFFLGVPHYHVHHEVVFKNGLIFNIKMRFTAFYWCRYLQYQFVQGDISTISLKIVIDVHLFYHDMVTHKGQLSQQQPPGTFQQKIWSTKNLKDDTKLQLIPEYSNSYQQN